ncbi:hypothetical protein K461DRAFT_282216 [Myriangium duriaei CBS 260.36]|uniref:Uncharacterized protein n=1 Tax=Myriangium duriaei CBS 260.36 TaxID=1168546 RepID=A0A9P4IU32_9PEZI|nr:hypothetical protein K461DRAFT_282216 [Myriangium duriaei CBS 260.36]
MFPRSIRLRLSPLSSRLTARPLSISTPLCARKDAQDKDSIKVEPNEYSKSGSDPSAAQSGEAFDSSKTRPEEHSTKDSDELNVSPANHKVSQPRGGTEGGAESSSSQSGQGPSDRSRSSGGSGHGGGYKGGEGKKYQ